MLIHVEFTNINSYNPRVIFGNVWTMRNIKVRSYGWGLLTRDLFGLIYIYGFRWEICIYFGILGFKNIKHEESQLI